MKSTAFQRQQGAALAISLVFLVALTLLGVATLNSARFQEQITSNAQQKAIAFEAAESAIISVHSDVDLIVDSIVNHPLGQYNDPDPVSPFGVSQALSIGLDQQNAFGATVDITADVTIQYCGERALQVGSELSGDQSKVRLVAMMFDVNGVAEIANTNGRSDHIERSSLTRPETMRSGDCTLPGL